MTMWGEPPMGAQSSTVPTDFFTRVRPFMDDVLARVKRLEAKDTYRDDEIAQVVHLIRNLQSRVSSLEDALRPPPEPRIRQLRPEDV